LPVEFLVWIAKKAGYDGIQYSPIRFVSAWQVLLGLLTNYAKQHIFAAEQSPRGEKLYWRKIWPWRVFREILNHDQKWLSLIFQILLPYMDNSLKHLLKLQTQLSRSIPMVIYPSYEGSWFKPKSYRLKNIVYQPEPRLITAWGITSPIFFIINIGICFDTDAARRLGWSYQELIEAMFPKIKLVHIRFRSKFETIRPGSSTGELDEETIGMIKCLVQKSYAGDWVIEMPMDGLSSIAGKWWFWALIDPWYFIRVHRKLVKEVRKVIVVL